MMRIHSPLSRTRRPKRAALICLTTKDQSYFLISMGLLRFIPNFLTFSRIVAVPSIYALWHSSQFKLALVVALLACLTDFLDGHAARALNQVSTFGAVLDPVADKVMILALFTLLWSVNTLPAWLLFPAVVRNVSQLMSIPVLMWWKGISFKVVPKIIPKVASTISYLIIILGLAIPLPDLPQESAGWLRWTIQGMAFLLVVLEVQIFATYCPRFIQIYSGKHDTFE